MGTITSGIGLASGIDTGNIIEQLVELERRPIQVLQSRIAQTSQVQLAYAELATKLNSLKGTGTSLRKPSTFDAAIATSANEKVAVAKAAAGAPEGRYELRVRSLVQSQQAVTAGFGQRDAVVSAGRVTVEVGGGSLLRETPLADLNDRAGVAAGKFRLTDAHGRDAIFDAGDYDTLEDVVDAINLNLDIDVSAAVVGGALVLRDESGGAGTLRVRDLAGGTAAADLRLAESTRAGATRTTINGGAHLEYETVVERRIPPGAVTAGARQVDIRGWNGGFGVPTGGGWDFEVRARNGQTFQVNMSGATTVAHVIDTFNAATGNAVVLSIDESNGTFQVNDKTNGTASTLRIQDRGGRYTALALHIRGEAPPGGTRITSTHQIVDPADYEEEYEVQRVKADSIKPGGIPTAELRGGGGIATGTFTVRDRDGNTATIDADTPWLDEILDRVNSSGIGVTARINDAGNGIVLEDTTGGAGNLVVVDTSGTAAADLGLAGSHAAEFVDGGNLQRQWIDEGTLLSTYDVGDPVGAGVVKFTDSLGGAAELEIADGEFETLGEVIDAINALGLGITARVNDNGDGLLVVDNAGGTLEIEDVDGSIAKALRIAGVHDDGTADGTFEVGVDVAAGDTLEKVQDKLNQLGFGVRASLVNDGDAAAPWRLSLTAKDGGKAGAFNFDAGVTGLSARNIAKARDAVVYLGGGENSSLQPLKITSHTNQIENALPGLSLDLVGTGGGEPVEITVAGDQAGVVETMTGLVESFNALRDTIDERTSYNQETDKRGALLGEPTVQRAERAVYRLVEQVYDTGNPRYRILSDVGLRVGEGAKLEFDEEKFRAAWADDSEAVKAMFTATVDGEGVGFGHRLQNEIGELTDPADGLITRATEQLDDKNAEFEARIAKMEESVLVKQQRLQKQFLDMELALSKLQFQQQQLSAIPTFQPQQTGGRGNGGGGGGGGGS